MYADYNYYTTVFYNMRSTRIPETETVRYLKKASVFLDSLFMHEKPKKPYSAALSDACCEIADCLYRLEKTEGISCESNDGYSVTFDTKTSSPYTAAYAIAVRYLGAGGLLYRGLDR